MAGGAIGGYLISHAATDTPSPSSSASAAQPGTSREQGETAEQQVIADAIGITPAVLATELQGGKTVAQVAQLHGADVQKVVTALVAAETKDIDAALASGKITQPQADKAKANVLQQAQAEVNGVEGKHGAGRKGGAEDPAEAQAVADAIGITPAVLATELQGGKTIAQVAQTHNADLQKVVAALVTIENKEIDAELAAGKITQPQADQKKATVQQHVQDEINKAPRGR
jgi:uncharacterized protein (DUF433 family)